MMASELPNRKIAHRRERRHEIDWPVLGSVFLVFIGVMIILLLQRRVQVSLVADWMYTTIVLVPILFCTFTVYIALVVAIVMVGRLNRRIERSMQQGNDLAEQMRRSSATLLNTVASMTIRLASWFGVFTKIFDLLEINDTQAGEAEDQ